MQPIQSIQSIQQPSSSSSAQSNNNNYLRHSSSQSNIHSSTTYTNVSRVVNQQQQQSQLSQQSQYNLLQKQSQPQTIGKMFAREIEAQSSSSVDLKKQQLVMKLLMMSLQIQRKDSVVKNLLKELQTMQKKLTITSNSISITNSNTITQLHTVRQQLTHTKRYISQLQYKLQQLTITNNQLITNTTTINAKQQLQQRISFLQQKNKQLEITKIQLQSSMQKISTQNKMLSYKIINVESTQKGKLREMQNVIIQLQKKLDEQIKFNNQLKIVIQSAHQQIRVVKQNQQRIIQQYNQKFIEIQRDYSHQQDLKRSQAVNVQQRIDMTQQQLNRMQDEVLYWRKKGQQIQQNYQKKEQQYITQMRRLRNYQAQSISVKQQLAMIQSQTQQKSLHINQLTEQLTKSQKRIRQFQHRHQSQFIQIQQTYQHQLINIKQEIQTYQRRLAENQLQIQRLRGENRRLKRQLSTVNSDCQSCKILQSSTTIKSSTRLFGSELNLSEIIQQTQRLRDSAVKIQQILAVKRGNNVGNGNFYGESRMSLLQERSFYQ